MTAPDPEAPVPDPPPEPPMSAAGRPASATWLPPSPLGFHESILSGGTIAAPLLAGFSFTMTALVLQQTSVCRWPDVTLGGFVGAGILLIGAVQTSLWLRSFMATPADFAAWYPEHMIGQMADDRLWTKHEEWNTKAEKYARWTRRLYNFGILLLLGAVTTALIPPGCVTTGRKIVALIGAIGFAGELIWILVSWCRAWKLAHPSRGSGDVAGSGDHGTAGAQLPADTAAPVTAPSSGDTTS